VTTKAGWKQIFDVPNQLIINKAAIAGGAVIFTSYTPSLGLCEFGGSSNLCAYYMTTGTGYYKPILPDFRLCVSLGDGLAAAPYIKRLGNGKSVPIVQKSDGTIIDRSYVPDDSGKLVPVDPDALGADPDPLINEPHGESTGALFWQERTDLKNPD
jgi:Tfp pilus tip-associated adhesin PilY1